MPSVTPSFRDFVLDQLAGMADLLARPMFGGYGLYGEDRFFGLLWGGRMYLKTDEITRTPYVEAGMEPFSPGGKVALKNYYEVPAEVLEDSTLLLEWARVATGLPVTAPARRRGRAVVRGRKAGRKPAPPRARVKRSKRAPAAGAKGRSRGGKR